MNIIFQDPHSKIYIKSFSDKKIILSTKTITKNAIFTPNEFISYPWIINNPESFQVEEIFSFLKNNQSLIIFGTNRRIDSKNGNNLTSFRHRNRSIDFMNLLSACRTFNILANEDRDVVCCLFF